MIIERAHAKLNLALHVVGKRSDGYHDLEMIVAPLELADILYFHDANEIILNSNIHIDDNIIVKTARYMQSKYHMSKGAHITLEKHIPIGSGLGGESADVAATLRGLNKLWQLNLSLEDLSEIALELGSDTHFCLYNKTALVTGRGEHLKFLEKPPVNDVCLLISNHPISTKESFRKYIKTTPKISFESLLNFYEKKEFKSFFENAYNGLLKTAFSLDKTLENAYLELKKVYKNAYMTGSGSTLFLVDFPKNTIDLNDLKSISTRKVIKTTIIT